MTLFNRIIATAKAFTIPEKVTPHHNSNSSPFPLPTAKPGFLTTDVIAKLRDINGYFNEDDCMHFFLVLRMQSELGKRGDMLEIGSYFGRSTALLAYCLQPSERLVVCDSFRAPTEDQYSEKPTEQDLLDNILKINPTFDARVLVIHSCLSTELSLPETDRFRFIHVDGGHSHEIAYSDLCLAHRHISPKGIIAIDDFEHEDWPGVTMAVETFLIEHRRSYNVLADMNRHIAKGRKLYLIRNDSSPPDRTEMAAQ